MTVQNNAQKVEINNNAIKKEKIETIVNNVDKDVLKSKNGIDSKETNEKKKEIKKENPKEAKNRKTVTNEDKLNNNVEKNNRNESRSSSVSSLSPRRTTEHRNKDDVNESDKEHKKRKSDSIKVII